MNSAMIGKIEKAHRYAQEPERIQFQSFAATFQGGHDAYEVAFDDGQWTCSCHTFESHAVGNVQPHHGDAGDSGADAVVRRSLCQRAAAGLSLDRNSFEACDRKDKNHCTSHRYAREVAPGELVDMFFEFIGDGFYSGA